MLGIIALTLIGVTGWYLLRRFIPPPFAEGGQHTAITERRAPTESKPVKAGQTAAAAQPTSATQGTVPLPSSSKQPQQFGLNGPVKLDDVPAGRFHDQLARLSPEARARALKKLGDLHVPINNVASLSVDREGSLFFECIAPTARAVPSAGEASGEPATGSNVDRFAAAAVPITSPPIRHSKPGATNVIYLDFNGHIVTGTAWNEANGSRPAVATYVAKPYSLDADASTFSDAEQADIIRIWERVAEDYKPFDVDVTTEEPASFTSTTGRIVITLSKDANGVDMPAPAAGGVAYVDKFGVGNYVSRYSPAFVYIDNLSYSHDYIAEAASHEMGHNMGLSHDGTSTQEYYPGHGSGETSWGSIMGTGYDRNVTQWSKGEYYDANNPEDDLAIIAAKLSYRYPPPGADDYADTNGTATALTISGGSFSAQGVIDHPGDADRFAFTTGAGTVSISVNPFRSNLYTYGGNLDVVFELINASGQVLNTVNPTSTTGASLSTTLTAGTYYLRITGTGVGTPQNISPSGYTGYGSLGQYVVSGSITSGAPIFTLRPLSRSIIVGQTVSFTASANSQVGGSVAYEWRHGGQTISGSTGSTFSLASATLAGQGVYEVTATDSSGSSSSYFHLHVVPDKSTVVAWGLNDEGQTVVPAGLGKLLALAGGTRHTMVLKADGTVTAWGQSYYGQSSVPAGLNGVVAIAAGGTHSLALRADGTVTAWGDARFGSPGTAAQVPGGLDQVIAIDGGWGSSMALRADGTVITWGFSQGTPKPANLSRVVMIAAGAFHNLALKSDGTVVGWGDDSNGAATPPAGLNNVVVIAAGGTAGGGHSLALKADGTVVAWGYNTFGQCTVPAGLTNVVAIAAGGNFSLALKSDGTVVSWGQNDSGQLTIPGNVGGVAGLEAGFGHTLALVVAQIPTITNAPASQTVNVGDTAIFSVSVAGTAPFTYQWKQNGSALVNGGTIIGATFPTLQIANAQLANAGSYTVEIGNAAGTVVSSAAVLNVGVAPPIAVRPYSRAVTEGQPVSFSITMDGTGPFTYQWRRNGQVIAGAMGATLGIAAATYFDHGRYEAIITSADGGVARSVFHLEVGIANPAFVVWGDSPPTPPSISGSVAAIDAGGAVLALKGDGTVVAWGDNSSGEATVPAGLTNVVGVAAGSLHSLAVKSDGTVVGWGNNAFGQATPPADLTGVVAVAAGRYHSIALKADGTLVGWGSSDYGQQIIPAGLHDVVAIETGRFQSVALLANGTAVQWGYDFSGTAALPAGVMNLVAIANGEGHTLGLKADGTVTAWGYNYAGCTVVPPGLTGVVSVAAGDTFSLALKSDGTVVGWGRDYEHQATPPAGLSGVVALTASGWTSTALVRAGMPALTAQLGNQIAVVGDYVTLTVSVNGTIPLAYQWRRNGANLSDSGSFSGTNTATLGIDGVQAADAGSYDVIVSNPVGSVTSNAATLTVNVPPSFIQRPLDRLVLAGQPVVISARATDGDAVTYQWKHNGQLIAGAVDATITLPAASSADNGFYEVIASNSIAANHSYFSLKVLNGYTTNLTVAPWGENQYGSLGPTNIPAGLNNIVAVAAGENHAVALKADGTIRAWGVNNFGPTSVPSGLSAVVGIAAGDYHTLALKANGTVVSWGNYAGSPSPPPAGLRNVVAIAAKGISNLALKSDGTVVAWGMDPAPAGLNNVVAVAAGVGRGLALKSDGTIVAWGGSSSSGDVVMPTGLTQVVAVASGDEHRLVLKSDGTVVAWGRNDVGQATVPSGLSNVVAIAGGFVHSIALKADGTVVGWGRSNEGQTIPPAGLANVVAISSGSYYNLVLVPSITKGPPAITTQPTNQTVTTGGSVTFTVATIGTPAPTYQWQMGSGVTWQDIHDDAEWSGAATATLTIASWAVSALNGIQFRCVVTNSVGSVASNDATLIVLGLTADFNRDGYADIVLQNSDTGERKIWLMNGKLSGSETSLITVNPNWRIAAIADFNGDGSPDLLWENQVNGDHCVFLYNGITLTAAINLWTVNTNWSIAAAADFNGDGTPDIVWQNKVNGDRAIFYLNGTTLIGTVALMNVNPNWSIAAAADFDGDGKNDLLWQNTVNGDRAIFYMNNTVIVRTVAVMNVNPNWSIIAARDFNGDGKPDWLWENTANGNHALFIMNDTTITEALPLTTTSTAWKMR